MNDRFTAPEHLSDRAKALWSDLVPRRARSAGRMALLTAALEALDRADSARLELANGKLTTTTKTTGAVHLHPLLKVEREARAQFASIWGQLGFGWEQLEDGSDYGCWKRRQAQEATK